tara:strand:- start:82240 stop:82416 length:177 start_codon:yes stop_codon:yes gene_type:complete
MPGAPQSTRGGQSAPRYSAQDARGGEIILKTRRNRLLFIGGLAASVVAALVLGTVSLA